MRSVLGIGMKAITAIAVAFVLVHSAFAHPGTGIVVDDEGNVYFAHTGACIWKLDTQGKLTRREGPAYHYMIEDAKGAFIGQRWPHFADGVIEVMGTKPTLLCGSSFPITIGSDGALYYADFANKTPVHITRLEPQGKPTDFATLPIATEINFEGKPIEAQWIHGLAAGPDGNLYYAEKDSVRRIDSKGVVTAVAEKIVVPGCVRPAAMPEDRGGPVLRNLDVAADGTIYVAAAGCSAVLRITQKGEVSVALQAADNWSPMGVDVKGDDLYVLEFLYVDVQEREEWLPRVRKVSKDGTVTTLATITEVPK